MRGDVRRNYQKLLVILFCIVSGFTLLYFFTFTDSYAAYGTVKSVPEKVQVQEVITPSAEENSVSEAGRVRTDQEAAAKASPAVSQTKRLLPCGIPVGIYLETKGVLVAEVADVVTEDGKKMTPCGGLIEAGDYILQADQTVIESKEQFREIVQKSGGESIRLLVEHEKTQKSITIQPVFSESGCYTAGLWVRDNMHGIGTLTWLDEDGNFAALGHCISDVDTGVLLEISQGQLYPAEIYSFIKGSSHQPGSLAGAIDYRVSSCLGNVEVNTEKGVFGKGSIGIQNLVQQQLSRYASVDSFDALWEKAAVPVAAAQEIQNGKAQMMSCFNGTCQFYDIEIRKIAVDKPGYENINLEITVTDSALLKQTGGILQGMSGSPILQNGKLVGAVTHVFVEDSTKGYGILCENMLEHDN